MASRDPAFLWETEVLRTTSRVPHGDPSGGAGDHGEDWLTLREASEVTGVPASTIRKWARHENIPSFMEQTSDGRHRLVSLRGIMRWAADIGREIESPERSRSSSSSITGNTPQVTDLTEAETEQSVIPPEGSMLVPLDAWNRMLNQLGNLHEAGQQLAEARERAAKAETEARFLKERLADLRAELERAKEHHEQPEHSPSIPSGEEMQEHPPTPPSLIRRAYRGWRDKRAGRI